MLAHGVLALSLVVRIYDAYGVPDDHLAHARTTVESIMKSAGLSTTWPACPCLAPLGSGELAIRIVASSATSRPASLGFSFVDLGRKEGSLATVYADRVQALAAAAGVTEGELLGRVIAHEISHLLIGTREHASRGLMRGEWTATELAEQRPADWLLSIAEVRQIRQGLRRRSSEAGPRLMIVDADPTAPGTTAQ